MTWTCPICGKTTENKAKNVAAHGKAHKCKICGGAMGRHMPDCTGR
jgi:predicted RNA-binding Zn-ribbon protein involved in translation (DUF1610 family)